MKTDFAILAGALLLLSFRKKNGGDLCGHGVRAGRSRGERNNNPGNIRLTSSQWTGKIPNDQNKDCEFEQFENVEYGIRAALMILRKYYFTYGLRTIEQIVFKWAPPSENESGVYADTVAACSGIDRNKKLEWNDNVIATVLNCMFNVENGVQVTSVKQIKNVWAKYGI